jgi:hypothetical protein
MLLALKATSQSRALIENSRHGATSIVVLDCIDSLSTDINFTALHHESILQKLFHFAPTDSNGYRSRTATAATQNH